MIPLNLFRYALALILAIELEQTSSRFFYFSERGAKWKFLFTFCPSEAKRSESSSRLAARRIHFCQLL